MLKNSENNGTKEINLATPNPKPLLLTWFYINPTMDT